MNQVIILGCGIIGATIAYELSQVPGYQIKVIDPKSPATGATQAALGVLMGTISQKTKGRTWQLRKASMERYETLIPELIAKTGREIPNNQQGILLLCGKDDDLSQWENLVALRQKQGLYLEIWDLARLQKECPHLECQGIQAAIYSPQDRQVDPVALTLALVEAAKMNGVEFHWGTPPGQYEITTTKTQTYRCQSLVIQQTKLPVDWLVVAGGLGSGEILKTLQSSIQALLPIEIPKIKPVLGQALQIHCDQPLGNPEFQPVITYNDVHLVPIGGGDYWIGATVEFPNAEDLVNPDPQQLETVWQNAIKFCPALAHSQRIRQWSGLRPRPEGMPAPVLGKLSGYDNVLLATGHYRNGIFLAPATAQLIGDLIKEVGY